MKYIRYSENCLESLEGEFENFERRLLPLKSARGEALTCTFVEIGDLSFEWYTFNLDAHIAEAYVGSDLRISIPVSAEHASTYFGTPIEPCHGFVSLPGWEHRYAVREGSTALGINVPRRIVELMGWSGYMVVRQTLPTPARDHLVSLCSLISEIASGNGVVRSGPKNGRSLYVSLLSAIDTIIVPWRTESRTSKKRLFDPHGRYQLFQRASEILLADVNRIRSSEASFNADDLANRLGVSRSSMFDAFRKSVGVGPLEYLSIIRMYSFRSDLIKSRNTDQTVAYIAHEHGFTQLGRLAARYRDYFGELPSQTLKRAS